jgi:predicted NAD/FAD-dependent oxidoreductase
MSGLAAAHVLLDAGYMVTLFEKSHGVGGRAATRKRAGFIYDHGAQYIKQGSPESVSLITKRFRAPDLLDIEKPVWIFNAQNSIQEGDPQQNAEPKWTYRSGITALPTLMAANLTIHFETRIAHLRQTPEGWQLFTTHDQDVGTYDILLITIPAAQAQDLIQASQFSDKLQSDIAAQLQKSRYSQLLSVALGYFTRLQERPYYALVNTDKSHAISWLAWEHEKSPERVPPGGSMLIAQMAPGYSEEHREDALESLISDVAESASSLIDEQLSPPDFTDVQPWRYALPTEKADAEALHALTLPHGLAFCGDAFVGGRIHLALEHGLHVAHQLIENRS